VENGAGGGAGGDGEAGTSFEVSRFVCDGARFRSFISMLGRVIVFSAYISRNFGVEELEAGELGEV
jgi:hypothetical protein